MNNNITVIFPVAYINTFSTAVFRTLSTEVLTNISVDFVFVCYGHDVVNQVKQLLNFDSLPDNCKLLKVNNSSSNYLRAFPLRFITTPFVFYQDCDDFVDYDELKNLVQTCPTNCVLCLNILKRQYDENGTLLSKKKIYNLREGKLTNIEQVPTNIVNKIIPTQIIKQLTFFNIPFSQDLSLSYQLFIRAPHYYSNRAIYKYENYPTSSSNIRHTKFWSLLRILAVKNELSKLFKCRPYENAYVQYRYNVILVDRFSFIGKRYFPKYNVHICSIIHFGFVPVLKHIYYIIRSYVNCALKIS